MSKLFEHLLVAVAGSAFAWFAHWAYKDIFREKRPEVTEDMIDDAYREMLEINDYFSDD
jgi:hypothetical protein